MGPRKGRKINKSKKDSTDNSAFETEQSNTQIEATETLRPEIDASQMSSSQLVRQEPFDSPLISISEMVLNTQLIEAIGREDTDANRNAIAAEERKFKDEIIRIASYPRKGQEKHEERKKCLPFKEQEMDNFWYIKLNEVIKDRLVKIYNISTSTSTIDVRTIIQLVDKKSVHEISQLMNFEMRWILYAHATGLMGQNNGHIGKSCLSNERRSFFPIYQNIGIWAIAATRTINCWENRGWSHSDILCCWGVEATLGIHKYNNDTNNIPPDFFAKTICKLRTELKKFVKKEKVTILDENEELFNARVENLTEKIERAAIYNRIFHDLSLDAPKKHVIACEIYYGISKSAIQMSEKSKELFKRDVPSKRKTSEKQKCLIIQEEKDNENLSHSNTHQICALSPARTRSWNKKNENQTIDDQKERPVKRKFNSVSTEDISSGNSVKEAEKNFVSAEETKKMAKIADESSMDLYEESIKNSAEKELDPAEDSMINSAETELYQEEESMFFSAEKEMDDAEESNKNSPKISNKLPEELPKSNEMANIEDSKDEDPAKSIITSKDETPSEEPCQDGDKDSIAEAGDHTSGINSYSNETFSKDLFSHSKKKSKNLSKTASKKPAVKTKSLRSVSPFAPTSKLQNAKPTKTASISDLPLEKKERYYFPLIIDYSSRNDFQLIEGHPIKIRNNERILEGW